MAESALSVTQILDRLSEASQRPRYAFMILNLLAEQAGSDGRAGPFIIDKDQERLSLREYIGKSLSRMSGRDRRRKQLEKRVREELAGNLPDDLFEAQKIVDQAVDERARGYGADNFSRVVSELEKCGYLRRYYDGYPSPTQIGEASAISSAFSMGTSLRPSGSSASITSRFELVLRFRTPRRK